MPVLLELDRTALPEAAMTTHTKKGQSVDSALPRSEKVLEDVGSNPTDEWHNQQRKASKVLRKRPLPSDWSTHNRKSATNDWSTHNRKLATNAMRTIVQRDSTPGAVL